MGFWQWLTTLDVSAWLNALGGFVLVPIILLILALIVRVRFGQALKNAIMVGVGLVGLNTILGIAAQQFTPIAEGIAQTTGLHLAIADLGDAMGYAIAFSWKFAGFFIVGGLVLNLLMLLTRTTKTIDIDVQNFYSWALSAQLVYLVTGSYLWSWVAFFATGIVSLKLGDLQAPTIQKEYDLPGISFPHPFSTFFTILAPAFERLFESIPGFRKIDINPESLQEKIGPWGHSGVLGFFVGVILALLAGFDSIKVLQFGMMLAFIMIFLPYVINALAGGLIPLSDAVRSFLSKKFKGREYYIGLDCAIGAGQVSSIMTGVILIPIALVLAAVLPGNKVLPMADLPFLAFWVSGAMAYFKRNILRGVIYGTVMVALSLWMATIIAPIVTAGAKLAGVQIPATATLISDLDIYPWSWICTMIAKLAHSIF